MRSKTFPRRSRNGVKKIRLHPSLVAAAEVHICFVIKGNIWWKHTFLPMVTIVVLHHKHMKLFKPFAPHVTEWSV